MAGNSKKSSHQLDEYAHHKEFVTYRPARIAGACSAPVAYAFGIYGMCTKDWLEPRGQGFSLGIWESCYSNLEAAMPITEESCFTTNIASMPRWQSSIIGTLMFALAFGIIAVALTVSGLKSSTLSRRIYYFHSAGEIYFVCALCSTVALVAFPAVMELSSTLPEHEYGIGYYLAWGSPLCFYVSALCMSFDDMIHTYARKGCCRMCPCGRGRRKQQRSTTTGSSANGSSSSAPVATAATPRATAPV